MCFIRRHLAPKKLVYSATGHEDRINYFNFLNHGIFWHSDQIFYFAELVGKPGRELAILQLRGRDALCFVFFKKTPKEMSDGHKYVQYTVYNVEVPNIQLIL